MSQGAFLSNITAKRYAKQPIADQASYEKKIELAREYLTPDSEVLEIGFGTGTTALLQAPYVKSIEGIDYAREMVKIANEKASDQGITNAVFRQGDINELAENDKRYDVVMAMNILHMVTDQLSVIKSVHALLKPGGYFISSTICSFDLPWYLNAVVKLLSGVRLLPPINVVGEESLKEKLTKAGFSVVEEWKHGEKFKVVFLVARK